MPALDISDVFTAAGLATLFYVTLIDHPWAGHIVVNRATSASGLPARARRRVIMLGVAIALVFLIGFALAATWLLHFTGLLLAGGLLLLWVAYNMYRELRPTAVVIADDPATAEVEGPPPSKTFLQAAIQITVADLSMSLDNVLAVAAAAREHPTVLLFGLALSVSLMGLAANFVARLVQRFQWIAWIGLVVILFVAGRMIWDGWWQVAAVFG
jgi:YjbE family integral membrane protein